ncbi:MAG: SPFH domain-containing protein [Bacteroidota bacterium]
MALWNKLRSELIDIIEWLDESQDTMVYRFERYQNEIKSGAQLTVREGQVAVFVDQGQVADVFSPGMYTLDTANLPILSTIKGWKYGFNSPFKSEVYFVSTRNFTDLKWGTKNAIMMNDDRFGLLEVRAYGTYVIRVSNPSLFIKEIVGTDGRFTTDEIRDQLQSMVITRFTDAIGEANLPVEAYAGQTNEISGMLQGLMNDEFADYGLELTKFLIENVSMPEEIKEEIFELSRLNKIDLHKLAQMKAAKAMEKAAANPSGTAGAGVGMGMGFAMANQMGHMFNPMQQPYVQPGPYGNAGTGSPPPLPQSTSYFVAINGQQSGPFDMNQLQGMAARNELSRDTLVWSQGMPTWLPAGELMALSNLFQNTPPPIPG